MTTKKSTSSAKRATTTKKPSAKAKKVVPAKKAKSKSGFVKTAGAAVGEIVLTIADGAVQGVATAAKGLLEKQIDSKPDSAVRKAASPTKNKVAGKTGQKVADNKGKKGVAGKSTSKSSK